jgi:O-antigen ligase
MRILTLFVIYYACAFYGLFNPFFGLLFLIHIIIFRPENLVWGNLAFGRLHLITTVLILAGYFLLKRAPKTDGDNIYQKRNLLTFGLFVVWLFVVSIFAEVSVRLSLEQATEVAKIFIMCWLFTKLITTESRANLYVWVTVISFGLLGAWGFQQSLLGNTRLDYLWVADSNAIAAQFALMAPLALAKVLEPALSSKVRLLFFACTVAMILAIFATESRSGFVALAVGMAAFISMSKYRVRIFSALAVLIILTAPWVSSVQRERLATIFAPADERDVSAASRPILWQLAFRIWEDYPVAGVGLQNFSYVKENYAAKVTDIVRTDEMYFTIFDRQRVPHGVYTGMLAEAGLVGVVLFMTLLLRNIYCRFPRGFADSVRSRGWYLQARGAQAGLAAFIVAAMFSDVQYIEMLYFQVFFLGAIRGFADRSKNEVESNNQTIPAGRLKVA